MPIILDHSIVGQSLTTLTIRKDREFAACRICGAIFQSMLNIDVSDGEYDAEIELAAHIETTEWRRKHNRRHSEKEHGQFRASGLTLTPEAAHKLAPFGLVAIGDSNDVEVAQAMYEAPRAPVNDVETTLKGWV
jgi:hypothetical protein